MGWKQACEFALGIAKALECAHDHGIIHRDIKPQNIIIGSDNTPKVTDFGIARTTGSDTVIMSGNNSVFGSVHYISPEQARGGYVDAASDVYSLGVVLYEMLTGKVPFDGDNPVSVALRKLEPKDIRDFLNDIPDEVADIVMKAIAKEQYIRYQDASEMAADLKNVIEGGASLNTTRKKRRAGQGKKQDSGFGKTIIVMSLILAVILGVASFIFFSGGRKEYKVPDLMDKTLEEAIILAQEAGFKIDEDKITYVISEEYGEGKILKQTPGANKYVKRSGTIELVISAGDEEGEIKIPDVVGMSYEKAVSRLKGENLKYRRIDESSDEFPEGDVVRQSPKSGTKVSENYVVILHVSTGPAEPTPSPTAELENAEVPNIMGKTFEEAKRMIENANLKLGNVLSRPSEEPKDMVISQNPKPGSDAVEGSVVDIFLSEGPESLDESPMPNPDETEQSPSPSPEAQQKVKKNLAIQLPPQGEGSVNIMLIADGVPVYNGTHEYIEQRVVVPIEGTPGSKVSVDIYFDGVLQSTRAISF